MSHKEIKARPEPLLALLEPFRDDLVVGVECMHCWYWISDLCEEHGIHFILGHALKTIPGVGRILALTILYEVGDIQRFESVQKFASYARLVKCKAESAGKVYGTQGNKIGNAHLKWAFSEASVLFIRNSDKAKRYVEKLQKRMNKPKALSALAHKLGRAVYFMLKDKRVFDEQRFLKG